MSIDSVTMCRNTRSTRFPYTTLFRSLTHGGLGASGVGPEDHARQRDDRRPRADGRRLGARRLQRAQRLRAVGADRKSTRLNSSHVEISYAVFCLKKKNKLYGILLTDA